MVDRRRTWRRPRAYATTVLLLGLLVGAGPGRAGVSYRTVALTGTQAPGAAAGVVFTQIVPGSMNNLGQNAFFARVAGPGVTATNVAGLWTEGTGQLDVLVRGGDAAPGVSGGVLGGFFVPAINDNGESAFKGLMFFNGAGIDASNNEGVWKGTAGSLELVARKGSAAPGVEPGVVFDDLDRFPALNSAGQTAFYSSLLDTGGGSGVREGYWSQGSGSLELVAQRGADAPDVDPGFVYRVFANTLSGGRSESMINAGGATAFAASVGGPSGFDDLFDAIWIDAGGTTQLVAKEGDPVPGFQAGTTFGTLAGPALNATGDVAFIGTFSGPSDGGRGIWVGDTNSLRLAVNFFDDAPDTQPGVYFDAFFTPKLNGAGEVAFRARLDGTGIGIENEDSLWRERNGALELIAQAGDAAPGTDPGVVFRFFSDPAFNNAGQSVFFSQLVGPGVNTTNDFGFWAMNTDGELELLFREGDLFDINDDPLFEDFRTISTFSLAPNSNGEDGRRNSFNSAGQLAFILNFTDGTQGLFVASLTAALEGDYNDDGSVDQGDLDLVLLNWGEDVSMTGVPSGWINQQPAGLVGQAELDGVLLNWGDTTETVGVPEPTTVTGIMIGGLGLLRRRPV